MEHTVHVMEDDLSSTLCGAPWKPSRDVQHGALVRLCERCRIITVRRPSERQAASQIVGVIPRTSHLAAGFVVQLADGDGAAPTEAERQAALEARGWDGAEGGGDEG